jgi:hypothetical protein
MPFEAFERGDILIQGKFHALLWVGGEKPLVHNVDKGTFVGVIRARTLSGGGAVYRFAEAPVANRAADFAAGWADTPGTDFMLPQTTPAKVVLKTPYSHGRMGGALEVEHQETPWSVDALFRALKAIARARDGAGLSPNHGVSCSQFVTFCFQAAALAQLIGNVIPSPLLAQIRRDAEIPSGQTMPNWVAKDYGGSQAEFWKAKAFGSDNKVFKSLKTDGEFIRTALSGHVDAAKNALPPAMRTDAKRTTVEKLLTAVSAPESGFQRRGDAVDGEEGSGIPYRIKT